MPARLLGLGEGLLLAGVGLAAARLIWLLVVPAGPVGDWPGPPAQPSLLAALPAVDPFNKGAAAAGEAVVSDLDLVLAGTRVDGASGRGSAIIAAADGVQQSFAVGDEVIPGVRLVAVAFDSVTLARDGVNETLFLDQSAGPVPVTPAGDAGTRPRLLADLALVPRLDGTRITGFILNPKGSGQAFAAAGLQAGDVLVAVDGQSVAQVRDPAVLAQRLDGGGAQVTIERGGKPITFKVTA
jgi:general secretion pathway protein C